MLTTGRRDPMSVVEIDRATGALVVEGQKVFPLVLSDGPPLGAKTPAGEDALAVLAAGGANFIRVGRARLERRVDRSGDRGGARGAGRGCGARPPLLAAARQRARSLCARARGQGAAAHANRRAAQGPSGARRLEGDRRAREPQPARPGAGGRARARLPEAAGDRSRPSGRDHPGSRRHRGPARSRIGRPSTSPAPTSIRSPIRRGSTQAAATATSGSSAASPGRW